VFKIREAPWFAIGPTLSKESPGIKNGCGYKIDLPWGDFWELHPTNDIGAFQNDQVIEGPPFRFY
jgi:hypothetical protein